MHRSGSENWKWAVWGGVAITLLSIYPQLVMWQVRGRDWNGAFAEVDGDEWAYSAYVQALIDGRPRRNDPYTGRGDVPGQMASESLFSIQFVPSYAISIPARLLRVTSSTAFIALAVIGPFFSCLSIFWLIANVTREHRLAAAGSVVALCFGALAGGQGVVHLLFSDYGYSSFLFLRRYEPLAAFPLFFVFCALVWKSLTTERRQGLIWSLGAGATFALLVFSYFYLWTSAIAWFACLGLLWFIGRPKDLEQRAWSFVAVLGFAIAALTPYAILLSRRSSTMDGGQQLALLRAPDLFRIPEFIGLGAVFLIVFGALRGRINWRAPESLFAVSLALMPIVVFNQQIISGRSLQPFHYEVFIANYVALIAVVMATFIFWKGRRESVPVPARVVGRVVFVALLWGLVEVVAPTKFIVRVSEFTDRAAEVCQRLKHLAETDASTVKFDSKLAGPTPLVLASEDKVALILPTFAPQALLWESHFEFLDVQPGERSERFYQYLYFLGIDGNKLTRELGQPMNYLAAATFGHDRVIPGQSVHAKPIAVDEITHEVNLYQEYVASFTRAKAEQHRLSFLILPADGSVGLSNLDRWYQRDEGERIGDHILYRVQLRP